MTKKPPIIGITADMDEKRLFLNKVYAQAVIQAGGLPIVLPTNTHSTEALEFIDGLLLSGGGDIHAANFGQPLHEMATDVNTQRDEAEICLGRAAIARNMPIFGICRGMQMLNVLFGGDLVQHIDGHKQAEPRNVATHNVVLSGKLAALLGVKSVRVNSIHHQVPDKIGHGLEICAYSEDGYVEAIWAADKDFVLGVQWHPEELMAQSEHVKLFAVFVDICRK